MHNTDIAIEGCEPLARLILPYLYRGYDLELMIKAATNGELNLPRQAELALAKVGKLKVVSVDCADLSDGSEVKCIGLKEQKWTDKKSNRPYSRFCYQLVEKRIKNKTGKLRIIAWNKFLNEFHFFIIPHRLYSKNKHLLISLNKESKTPIGKYASFQCSTFKELAIR